MPRVVTFNILSSALASPSHYPLCNALFLAPAFRLATVLRKLTPEVKAQSLICLQEVSLPWLGPLHTFFAKHGYHYISAQYGGSKNGFMGVGIAVPIAGFEMSEVSIVRLSDTKSQPPSKQLSIVQQALRGIAAPFSFLYRLCRSWLGLREATGNLPVWEISRSRMNQMVSVKLNPRKDDAGAHPAEAFSLSCYHMPCVWQNEEFMTLHCALAAQQAHAFAQGGRYILAGDFNIKPGTPQYKMLTLGECKEHVPEPEYPGDPWTAKSVPLRSAYAIANGREPPFTNFAQGSHKATPFIETLDYIFLSKGWDCHETLSLPTTPQEAKGPLPTETEPSDHLMLAATVDFTKE